MTQLAVDPTQEQRCPQPADLLPSERKRLIAQLIEGAPLELRDEKIWCLYRYDEYTRFGRRSELLFDISGQPISIPDDPRADDYEENLRYVHDALCSFEGVVAALTNDITGQQCMGAGILALPGVTLTRVTLGHMKFDALGLPSWSRQRDWLKAMNTYAQVDPEGTSVSALMYGSPPQPLMEISFDAAGNEISEPAEDHSRDITEMFRFDSTDDGQFMFVPITGQVVLDLKNLNPINTGAEIFIQACRQGDIALSQSTAFHWEGDDLWAAAQFAGLFDGKLKYAVEEGLFYAWDGSRWVRDVKKIKIAAAYRDFVDYLRVNANRVSDEVIPAGADANDPDVLASVDRFSKLQDAYHNTPAGVAKDQLEQKLVASNPELFGGLAADDKKTKRKKTFRQAYLNFVKALKSGNRRNTIIDLFKQDSRIACSANDFDRIPHQINVENGVVDLRKGELILADSKMMHSKQAKAGYDPVATVPLPQTFLNAIRTVCQTADGTRRIDLERYLQVALGLSCTGDVQAQCMFLSYGFGFNGKSKLLATVRKLLGDYATKAPEGFMTRSRSNTNSRDPFMDIMLRGARLVLQSETEQGDALDTGMLKRATEDVIKTRPAYGQPIEFELTHKMWLDTNYEPKIRELDKGTWRRIKLIHHTFEIPARDRDLRIEDKFWDERNGIFAWLVEGARLYYAKGLDHFEPACVKEAVANYKGESDILAEFIEECVVKVDPIVYGKFRPEMFTPNQDMRQAYLTWAGNRGVTPVADTTLRSYLVKEMKLEHGHNTKKTQRGFKWCLVREQRDAKKSSNIRYDEKSHKLNNRQNDVLMHIANGGPLPLSDAELKERVAERREIQEVMKTASVA